MTSTLPDPTPEPWNVRTEFCHAAARSMLLSAEINEVESGLFIALEGEDSWTPLGAVFMLRTSDEALLTEFGEVLATFCAAHGLAPRPADPAQVPLALEVPNVP
jgi:hypothetical protein